MGTRAAFFIGDPCDLENRIWLGCKHFDGYPEGVPGVCIAKTEQEFRDAVAANIDTDPADDHFPYPWLDDLFTTDYVFMWAEGEDPHTMCSYYGSVWFDARQDEPEDLPKCGKHSGVKAPGANEEWDPGKDPSIMIIGLK
jgi:hypothetical protein